MDKRDLELMNDEGEPEGEEEEEEEIADSYKMVVDILQILLPHLRTSRSDLSNNFRLGVVARSSFAAASVARSVLRVRRARPGSAALPVRPDARGRGGNRATSSSS